MSPELFAEQIAKLVAQYVSTAPPKQVSVERIGDGGKLVTQHGTLPQIMAELCDHMRMQNELLKIQNAIEVNLIEELQKNRKVVREVLRRSEDND